MENPKYSFYNDNDEGTIKGNTKKNTSEAALANRPLSSTSIDNKNIDKSIKGKLTPAEDIHKSGNIPINTKYNLKEGPIVPIAIKPENSNYVVVVENKKTVNTHSDVLDYTNSDKLITDMPVPKNKTEKDKEKSDYKMNLTTQFYVGSLTVIGLFVFYRLLQKTR
jgi:hypothetical protein